MESDSDEQTKEEKGHSSKLSDSEGPIPINNRRFPDLRSEEFLALVENLPYNLIETFNNEDELDKFFRLAYPKCIKGKSEWRGCGECGKRSGHKMRYNIRICSCDNKSCIIQFKVQICQLTGIIKIYQRG